MNAMSFAPSWSSNQGVPKEIIQAYHAGYPYYYVFRLDDERERAIYENGKSLIEEYHIDHQEFVINNTVHIVLRSSLGEVIDSIKKRMQDTLDGSDTPREE